LVGTTGSARRCDRGTGSLACAAGRQSRCDLADAAHDAGDFRRDDQRAEVVGALRNKTDHHTMHHLLPLDLDPRLGALARQIRAGEPLATRPPGTQRRLLEVSPTVADDPFDMITRGLLSAAIVLARISRRLSQAAHDRFAGAIELVEDHERRRPRLGLQAARVGLSACSRDCSALKSGLPSALRTTISPSSTVPLGRPQAG